MGSEYRYLARYLGAPAGSFVHDLAVGQEPLARAQAALQEALQPPPSHSPAVADRPLVILAPFTTRPQKHWVESNWSELADRLLAQGLQPVVLGGPADREAAQRIASGRPGVLNFAGRLKLDESVALISKAQLLIGVDTGLTHMGSALRVPTVVLFGSTRPYREGPTPRTRILYDALSCSPCRRRPTCNGAFTCMTQLTVERVEEAAQGLLRSFPGGRP
jgi:heptosyltransferase-1